MKPIQYFLISLIIIGSFTLTGAPAAAQEAITLESFRVANNFPDDLTFQATASSSAGDITGAKLVFHLRNQFSSESISRITIEVEPARQVELSHTWDTSAGTIPGAAVIYYWEVTDSAGNQVRSDEMLVRYEDTRYDWQIIENEAIAVWWHDRRASFGERVFEIASQAVEAQRALFQADLDFQMRIIIYNNFDEFAEWNGVVSEFIGGQAFPDQGVTAQIVSAYGSQERWLNDVIPHEISHLYFGQVTFNLRSDPPTWLNEGVAQFNEFGDPRSVLREVERAAGRNELISLSKLEHGFGYFNEARTRLAYAEALSAVTYLVEVYGQDGLADLLAAYRRGLVTDEAIPDALGVLPGEFEGGWATWLGIEEGQYATPTPWPLPTFRASPTPFVLGTAVAPSPTDAHPANPTAMPIPPAATSTPVPLELEPFPLPASGTTLAILAGGALLLCCVLGLALIAALVWWVRRGNNR